MPFLRTEHASCLSPEAPKAGKGAAALVLQVAACPALANTTLDPLLLAGSEGQAHSSVTCQTPKQ